MPSQPPPHPSCGQHATRQAGTGAKGDNCPGKGGGCLNFRKVLYLGHGKSGQPSWKGKYENPTDSHQLMSTDFTNAVLILFTFQN